MSKAIAHHTINSSKANGTLLESSNSFKFSEIFCNKLLESTKYRRSLAKDGLLASFCLEQAINKSNIQINKSRVGIYSAALNGPLLYDEYDKSILDNGSYDLTKFKKMWPPKQHFRQNGPLRATHYSLQLKTQGPLVTMVDPRNGLIDALNWAEIDLFDDTVDYAIVIAGFSFEDPQLYSWYKTKSTELSECGVCLILGKDGNLIQHQEMDLKVPLNYGICTPLFQLDYLKRYDLSYDLYNSV